MDINNLCFFEDYGDTGYGSGYDGNNSFPQNCIPKKIQCSCNPTMESIIKAIIHTVNNMSIPGFGVLVEFTKTNGVKETVNINTGVQYPAKVEDGLLIVDDIILSICEISKIKILSGNEVPAFKTKLLEYIKEISENCRRHHQGCGCSPCNPFNTFNPCNPCNPCNSCEPYNHCKPFCKNDECAQSMQDIINENDDLDTIGYTGSNNVVETISIINGMEYVNVMANMDISNETTPVIDTVTPSTETAEFVDEVIPANTTVVQTVDFETRSLVYTVDTTPASVSGPVTVTETNVIQEIGLTPVNMATDLSVTPGTVVGSLDRIPMDVVTSFENPTTITGVISNVDSIDRITPTEFEYSVIESTSVGLLQVVIPAGSIDVGVPPEDRTFNVTIDGANVSYIGGVPFYALNAFSTLLGGVTAEPSVTNITTVGEPVIEQALADVTENPATVVGNLDFNVIQTNVVDDITQGPINTLTQPDTVEVINTVTPITERVNVITAVDNTPVSDLFTTTASSAVTNVDVGYTTTDVINSSSLDKTPQNVVKTITTQSVEICCPSNEDIDGNVLYAGGGALTVENTNGDISIYSICDVNSVTTN